MKQEPLNKAGRYAARHAEKSVAAADDLTGELEWLCRHRDDQMCVNCAPLIPGEKAAKMEMLCRHGPKGQCVNCLPPDSAVDNRKFQSYQEWLDKRKARCEHSFAATCVNCAAPPEPVYRLKLNCGRHRPWPAGSCLHCKPATVQLKAQPFRHVDYLQIDAVAQRDIERFLEPWLQFRSMNVQRAGFLLGRYVPDPNYPGGVKAQVECVYEPPQRCDAGTGVVKLLDDPRRRDVDAVCRALGIQAVGWIFTQPTWAQRTYVDPATGKEKELPDVMPHELFAMAVQQLNHPIVGVATATAAGTSASGAGFRGAADISGTTMTMGSGDVVPLTHSRFVTMVMRSSPPPPAGNGGIDHAVYMASDQMVAIVRDGVVQPPAPTDPVFKVRVPQRAEEPPVPEVISQTENRMTRVTEFSPWYGLVTLESGAAVSKPAVPAANGAPAAPQTIVAPLFRRSVFDVENREELGVTQTAAKVKRYLQSLPKAEPMQSKLADFHLLLFLARLLDPQTAAAAAVSVAQNSPVNEGIELLLDSILQSV
jgi:nuclear protein localization family protein 4